MVSASVNLRVQIISDRALQPAAHFADQITDVFQVVASGDAEFADEVLGRGLEVTVVIIGDIVFRAAEIGVGGNSGCALEPWI
jgi:phage-related minor tail protein